MKLISPLTGRETEVRPTPYGKGEWKLVECCETGFVFLPNPPAYEALADTFDWDVTFTQEKQRRFKEEPIISRLSLWAARTKMVLRGKRKPLLRLIARSLTRMPAADECRVLDIGCASGKLMWKIIEGLETTGRKFVPFGVEISPGLARRGDEEFSKLGGGVVEADAISGAEKLKGQTFDVIVMSSFLEHEAQPLALLRALYEIAPEHGRVVIKVPNFASVWRNFRGRRWCGFRYPEHVNYFTAETLGMLANEAGFEIERQGWREKLPTSDSLYAVLKKQAAMPSESRLAA